jgi:hypothetical protein
MHKKGIDSKSPIFNNVGEILDFENCAGYNFYLHPAKNAQSINATALDNTIATETLKSIIAILQPDFVVFFSKKSRDIF